MTDPDTDNETDQNGDNETDPDTDNEQDQASYESLEQNEGDEGLTFNNEELQVDLECPGTIRRQTLQLVVERCEFLVTDGEEDSNEPPDYRDDWGYLKHWTISRDHTAASSRNYQLLAALRSENAELEQRLEKKLLGVSEGRHPRGFQKDGPVGSRPHDPLPPTDFHDYARRTHSARHVYGALQDYKMQLLILEQQNKKRLMMARLDQDITMGAAATPVSMVGSHTQVQPGNFDANPSSKTKQVILLGNEIKRLQDQQIALGSTTWLVLHKVESEPTTCLVEPSWISTTALKGNSPLADEKGYLNHRPDVAFVIYKYYDATHQAKATRKAKVEGQPLPEPLPHREVIKLQSKKMIDAFDMFVNAHPTFRDEFPGWDSRAPIPSPFLFWYAYRSKTCLDRMSEPDRSQMNMLTEWIEQSYVQMYTEAKIQFSRGLVSTKSMPFFCKPGEVLAFKNDKGIRGYIADSWAHKRPSTLRDLNNRVETWLVRAHNYGYDGRFYRIEETLLVNLEFNDDQTEVEIKDLRVLPLRLATDEVRCKLERRGHMMWACRHRSLVAYDDRGSEAPKGVRLSSLISALEMRS